MIIKNIDNEYLLTHRYGWHNIMYILQQKIYPNKEIIIVDFMDKYFNYWFEMPKIIPFQNKIYNFKNSDAYYRINDVDKADIFIKELDNKKYLYLRWYQEHNEFKELFNQSLINFKKKYNTESIDKNWIGILHYPEFIEEMNYLSYESLDNILKSDNLQKSIINCKGIVVLSEYLKKYLIKCLDLYNLKIPIKTIFHPTNFDCIKFDYNNFLNNNDKKIIQLGFWMRNMKSIFEVKTETFKKYWLPGGKYWKEMFYKMYDNAEEILNNDSVIIKMYLSNEEYDEIISSNICLVNVYNSSANNSILECISRNIPLLVNNHPAIIEYLGINYPFYYSDINDLNHILEDNELLYKKIYDSHLYLLNLDKNQFKIDFFCKKFKEFIDELNL